MTVNRGRFILLGVLTIFALGFVGLYQLNPDSLRDQPADSVYRILQLFFGEGDWTLEQPIPVTLQLARFLAPIVAVGSLLLLFAEGLWVGLVNLKARTYRDHIVIVGLSDAAFALIQNCRDRNISVVVVEHQSDNRLIPACRSMRIPVFIGDGRHTPSLLRARIHRASCLVSFIDNDDDNVELSLRVQEQLEETRNDQRPLKVVLQVKDMQLGARLEGYPKFFEYPQNMEVRFFNPDEQASRELFSDYFPDVYADALGLSAVHIVIVGYETLGRHVLMTALKQAHFGNDERLIVTVLDPQAHDAQEMFERQCPDANLTSDVRFRNTGLSPEELRNNADRLNVGDATMIVSAIGSDSDNLTMALALRQMALLKQVPNAPIFVGLRNSGGLARLVESGQGGPEIPDGLYPFGMTESLMRVDRIVNERLDEIAIAMHEKYLETLGKPAVSQPSHRPWGMLPEIYRGENRAQADHVSVKLRSEGYRLVRERTEFTFSEDEVEHLASMEKNRWNAWRTSMGWAYGEHRSDLARVHPGLKSWHTTSEAEREFDLNAVRELPALLARVGLGVMPQIVIGITGHRANRILQHLDFVAAEVRKELEEIRDRYPGVRFAILSALADGSDRLIADLAVEILDADLIAALPLPYEIYKRSFGHGDTFTNQESNEEFQRFVGRSAMYFEMPLRSGGVEVLERDDRAGEMARAKQYALAGAYIVSRAHEMVAVWDGQEARGEGGTGDVVQWRNSGVIPEEYRFEGHFFADIDMHPARVISIPVEEQSESSEASAG